MSTHPTVSVVVPVYNDVPALRRCLAALQRQDYPADRVQVLVVDNASSEDVSAAVPEDPRFRLLHEARRGSYAARNTGVLEATGEVLAFTDSDCVPRPDWLRLGVAALHADPRPDAIGGAIEIFFPHGPHRRTGPEHFEAHNEFQQRRYVEEWSFAATANVFVTREVFDRVGPFDARLKSGGDTDWGTRLVGSGGRLVFAPQVVVDHPARSTWRELGRKSVRVANGIADRTQHLGRGALARRAWREARGGMSIWLRVWGGSRPAPTDAPGRVRYAAAFSYVRALRVGVHLRRMARRPGPPAQR
ncbi:glycosyltransferase [Georgenia sp. Z1491]|uniref:glycosyltransferase n=1 Tax=Georgenia sp. Z1491 TaxID=3416707 RepID=UPI003CF9648C